MGIQSARETVRAYPFASFLANSGDFLNFILLLETSPRRSDRTLPAIGGRVGEEGRMMRRRGQDERSGALDELSTLVLNLLRSPPTPMSFPDGSDYVAVSAASSSRRLVAPEMEQITPSGFASLLLGISLAMMLCGSVTFFIGFMLMPWVLGLVVFLYVAGIISGLTLLGRSILYYATGPPTSPWKEITCENFFSW